MNPREDRDSDLLDLYRRSGMELPPREIDERILHAGRAAVRKDVRIYVRAAAAMLILGALLFALRDHAFVRPSHQTITEPYGYNEGRARAYLMQEKTYGGGISGPADYLLTAGNAALTDAVGTAAHPQ